MDHSSQNLESNQITSHNIVTSFIKATSVFLRFLNYLDLEVFSF